MGFVDVAVNICSTFTIIFYDVGPLRWNRFATRWTKSVRDLGIFSYRLFLWRVQWLVQIICNLGKII